MSAYNVEAQVHMELKDKITQKAYAYRVRVIVLDDDLSFEINGMVVFPPSDKKPDWTVYTPTVRNARIIGFNTKETSQKSLLWPDIQAACITATQEYLRIEKLDTANDMVQYEGLSKNEFDNKLIGGINKLL